MKTSNKVQLLGFLLILILGIVWKFHLLPKELYGLFPVGIKRIKEICTFRRYEKHCAVFQCGRDLLRPRAAYLKLVPNKQNKFLLEGNVYFRNKTEVCAGLNGQKDTYFEVDNMVEILRDQNHAR